MPPQPILPKSIFPDLLEYTLEVTEGELTVLSVFLGLHSCSDHYPFAPPPPLPASTLPPPTQATTAKTSTTTPRTTTTTESEQEIVQKVLKEKMEKKMDSVIHKMQEIVKRKEPKEEEKATKIDEENIENLVRKIVFEAFDKSKVKPVVLETNDRDNLNALDAILENLLKENYAEDNEVDEKEIQKPNKPNFRKVLTFFKQQIHIFDPKTTKILRLFKKVYISLKFPTLGPLIM